MKTTEEKKDVYAIVNDILLDKLKQGDIPWNKSWNTFGPARNYVTNKPYRGFNSLLLNMFRFDYPLFMTFNQVKEMGGYIKKGAKSLPVIYWKMLYFHRTTNKAIKKTDLKLFNPAEVKKIPMLRYYSVFNVNVVEGIDLKYPDWSIANNPIDNCEQIVSSMPNAPKIRFAGDQPHYHKVTDTVTIPEIKNFTSSEKYYSVLFHELSHSTGHQSRLNRESLTSSAPFGSKVYSFEELTAEIATCFISNEAGIIQQTIDNSSAYIQSWLTQLTILASEDKTFFLKASTQAQKAADYILNKKLESFDSDDEDTVDCTKLETALGA